MVQAFVVQNFTIHYAQMPGFTAVRQDTSSGTVDVEVCSDGHEDLNWLAFRKMFQCGDSCDTPRPGSHVSEDGQTTVETALIQEMSLIFGKSSRQPLETFCQIDDDRGYNSTLFFALKNSLQHFSI